MASATSERRGHPVTSDEARSAIQRLINSHFGNKDKARCSIPCDPMDDDVVAADYVRESVERATALEAENLRLNNELNAGDSWAWIRRKFEKAGRNYRWFKPREFGGRDSLVGTRYEVMGWLHCLFGEADSSRTYLEICLEQQKRADEAEAWKREYLVVESEWDEQEVGKALNIPLGTSIRKGVLPKIMALKAAMERVNLENCAALFWATSNLTPEQINAMTNAMIAARDKATV